MATDTESADPAYRGCDTWDDARLLGALWRSQAEAAAAVEAALPAIAAAVAAIRGRLSRTGRLAYAGAGTSGRIACQDAAELGPTFGWPEERLLLLLAGGPDALRHASEGAEDDAEAGRQSARPLGRGDALIGVAASGRTPYTLAAVAAARAAGAVTVGVANVAGAKLLEVAEVPILVATGAEVLAGSTRLAAGTAQKIVLNLVSTLLMTRVGRVHDGLMVDMRPTNAKLRARAEAMVAEIAGVTAEVAAEALRAAGAIKPAVLVAHGLHPEQARNTLARHGDVLRPALAEVAP